MNIPIERINVNRFWEKTPTPLKYILIFVLFAAASYFIFSKKIDENRVKQIEKMEISITATYQLIDNFEEFRREQDDYNKEVLNYLHNLHNLVEELNSTTNRKFDMILKSGNKNADVIIDKILLLNESFEKISKVYQENDLTAPNLKDSKKYDIDIRALPLKDTAILK